MYCALIAAKQMYCALIAAKQMYCALIAAILMYDHFGKMPTKRQMEMLQFYLMEFTTCKELEVAFAENNKG